ncbi:hypothetical protein ACFY36_33815 [Actinoplanes sp. NPDC000266]
MTTVYRPSGDHQKDPDHRPGVIKKALAAAAGSAGGIAAILGAVAYGAIPVVLACLAMSIFGLIMVVALVIAGIYITRG